MTKLVDEASGAWQVMVERREGQPRGWCLPTFIHNGGHHYTELKVFEDGVVDCWGGLDLPLFRQKLTTGWIATAAPPGARMSAHGLGGATVEAFEPRWSLQDVEERVMAAIRHWNPALSNLVDLQGEDTELRGKVRWAKLPILDAVPFRQDGGGNLILGQHTSIFVGTPREPRLTQWFVFADGMSRLGPEGELVQLEAVEQEVLAGRAFCSIPDGAWLEVDGLGRARLTEGRWFVDPQELIKEQRDRLTQLQGRPSAVQQCAEAWQDYQREPSPASLEIVRERYLAVPVHLRMYCGDMDTKDYPIRAALGLIAPRVRGRELEK